MNATRQRKVQLIMFANRKVIFVCICIVVNLIHCYAFGDNNQKYFKAPNPSKYKKPSDLWGKSSYDEMLSSWFVFSDRDGLELYKPENKKEKLKKTFNFLDKFKVLDMTQKHLKVEEFDSKVRGWGHINEFIILSKAYRTKNSITHKAVIINKIGSIKGDINAVTPLRAPKRDAQPAGQKIEILEFANIYSYYPNKKDATYILLGKTPYYLPSTGKNNIESIYGIMLGWVPAARVLTWDTREALQPNPGRKHPIYYFKNERDLTSYYRTHVADDKLPTCENVIECKKNNRKDEELLVIMPDSENNYEDKNPWPKNLFRYAILNSNNDPEKPFEIGVTSATLDERIFQRQIISHIEKQGQNLGQRDVMFLIDATMSMGPYIKLAGKIAKDIMEKFKKKKKKAEESGKLRFGVALYRDYWNGDLCFEINSGGLTESENTIKNYLENIKLERSYEDIGDPAYYPEAVFQGMMNGIEMMDWAEGSRKLIIHIGDVGNNNRGQDHFTESDIAEKFIEKDISYCAIQIVGGILDNDHMVAQKLFCRQTRSIIIKTAERTLEIVNQYKDINIFPKNTVPQLQELINNAKQADCSQVNGVCTPFGKERWLLRCIQSNEEVKYRKTIAGQIDKLSSDIYNAKSILDNIRSGATANVETSKTETSSINIKNDSVAEIYNSEKNVSSKPFLMPGIVNRLVMMIGNDIFNEKDKPEIKTKIRNYIGPDMMKNINQQEFKNKIIQILGKNELKTYLNKKVNFFTKAYVMLKRKGEYKDDPDQLIKTVLFQKKDLEDLRHPLSLFKEKWDCLIHPENIKTIWRQFVLAILGENINSKEVDISHSIKELYEQQFGLSLRNSHPLLRIKYADIESGNIPGEENIDKLAAHLCKVHETLNDIYYNVENYFEIFGKKFIWIPASSLP